MSDKDKKSRWDYIGKEPENEKLQTPEKEMKEIGKMSIPPENYTQDQKWQLYEKLPEDLKKAMWSEKTSDIIGNLAEKYKFSDKVSKFAELVGYVFLGILPPEEFKERVKKVLGFKPEVLEILFFDIEKFIFAPVRESLNKLYDKGR